MLGSGQKSGCGGHLWHLWSQKLRDLGQTRCFPKEGAEAAQLKQQVQAVQLWAAEQVLLGVGPVALVLVQWARVWVRMQAETSEPAVQELVVEEER